MHVRQRTYVRVCICMHKLTYVHTWPADTHAHGIRRCRRGKTHQRLKKELSDAGAEARPTRIIQGGDEEETKDSTDRRNRNTVHPSVRTPQRRRGVTTDKRG